MARKVVEKKIGNKVWLIKEMCLDDALMVSTGIAKITGTSLFSLVASVIRADDKDQNIEFLNEIDKYDSEQLKEYGVDSETINQFESIKKFSGLFKRLLGVFKPENKEIVQEFLNKIYHKDLITLSKAMLKDAKYIDPETREEVTLDFDEYFTATKIPELITLFLTCFEVNYGGFFTEFLEKGTNDLNTQETETK